MKWLWWKHEQPDQEQVLRVSQAQQALDDSEGEMQRAAEQAGEAHIIAESLRELRATNHFGTRMKIKIQEGLRE